MKKEVEKTKKEMFNKRIFSKYLFSEEHIRSSSRTDDATGKVRLHKATCVFFMNRIEPLFVPMEGIKGKG